MRLLHKIVTGAALLCSVLAFPAVAQSDYPNRPVKVVVGFNAAGPADIVALLRAGHLAGAPLGNTWMRAGAGEPPRELVAATLGFPVIPVAIRPGGPLNLQLRPWKVRIGEPMLPPPGTEQHDQLAAAELSEQVRAAVQDLLEDSR